MHSFLGGITEERELIVLAHNLVDQATGTTFLGDGKGQQFFNLYNPWPRRSRARDFAYSTISTTARVFGLTSTRLSLTTT